MAIKNKITFLVCVCAVLTLGACNSITQTLSSGFDSWSVVPLETEQMRVAKAEKALNEDTRFSPQPNGPLGSFGLNLETYLIDADAAPDERIDRLERSVVALQKDLKIMAPTVQNLNAQNIHAHNLETQKTAHMNNVTLKALHPEAVQDDIDADAPPVSLNAAPSAPKAKTVFNRVAQTLNIQQDDVQMSIAPSTPTLVNVPTVTNVRTGVHKGIMRIVFDITDDAPYTVDLDNNERILVAEFPRAGWNTAALRHTFKNNALLKHYKVDSAGAQNADKIFILQLKKQSRIIKQTVLPATSGQGKRIVIDLKA